MNKKAFVSQKKNPLIVRIFLILAASLLFAVNIKTFINSANLFPGGLSGIALLIQRFVFEKTNISLPYSLLTYALNTIPVYIGFRYIGFRFTFLSLLLIITSGFITDIIPSIFVTDDVILCAVFGGVLNATAVALCLLAESSSGGTDFIAIFISEKTGKSAWNKILMFNVVILILAGFLFSWENALYSIVFQYVSTQTVNFLNKKYAKTTLLIITDRHEEIYKIIKQETNHDATLFKGTGKYSGKERNLLYTVVSSQESGHLEKLIRKADPDAFINVMASKEIIGKFFKRGND